MDDHRRAGGASVQDSSDKPVMIHALKRVFELAVGDRVGSGLAVVRRDSELGRTVRQIQNTSFADALSGIKLD